MKNSFELLDARMLYENSEVFMARGIFAENQAKNSSIQIFLDNERLTVREEYHEGVEVRQNYAWHPWNVDTEFFYYAKLPQNIGDKQSLHIVINNGKKKKEIYHKSIKKLYETRKAFEYSLESVNTEGDVTVLEGWVIWEDGMEISCYNGEGILLKSDIKYGYRRDIMQKFPEVRPDLVKGIKISVESMNADKILLCIHTPKKQTKTTLKLCKSPLEKNIRTMTAFMEKGYLFYQRNGLINTFYKARNKLFEADNVNYEKWLKKHSPSEKMMDKQYKRIFAYRPKISVVVPLYRTPECYLKGLVESVMKQTYTNWELCLSDGSGENSPIQSLLESYQNRDERIKVIYTGRQMQISENTNKALEIASGDYIAFADHDDLLAPNALYECVRVFNGNSEIRAVYSDEDKISMDGKKYFQPHFKPNFNRDLLNSTNYICHLFVVDKKIVDMIGGLDPQYNGAQDYDFVLRCSEITNSIYHIPKILYHWRAHINSTAENPESKSYAFEAGARAIKAHYDRIGLKNTKVSQTECLGIYRTQYIIEHEPMISVIIPNKDHVKELDKCLRSLKKQNYHNYEIIIVENNSVEDETFSYYELLKGDNQIKIVYWKNKFNYSAINNFGVQFSHGDHLLFLNNDTEMIGSECLREMVGFSMRRDVGAVGARLYYTDNTVQHAGVIIGLKGIAGHVFLNTPSDQVGYFARIISQQDYSAVTAACMMVRRDVFDEVNGFEEQLEVAFNDVDLCLKIRRKGYVVVYNPYAELYHYESRSRGDDNTEDKVERFNRETELFEMKWGKIIRRGDPYFNPNFALDAYDCRIK